MKFVHCKSRAEFREIAGFGWWKIINVEGGYIGFESKNEYLTWENQK